MEISDRIHQWLITYLYEKPIPLWRGLGKNPTFTAFTSSASYNTKQLLIFFYYFRQLNSGNTVQATQFRELMPSNFPSKIVKSSGHDTPKPDKLYTMMERKRGRPPSLNQTQVTDERFGAELWHVNDERIVREKSEGKWLLESCVILNNPAKCSLIQWMMCWCDWIFMGILWNVVLL